MIERAIPLPALVALAACTAAEPEYPREFDLVARGGEEPHGAENIGMTDPATPDAPRGRPIGSP
ncbi:MAG: hypothetical protein WD960_02380 [Gemmatimonadota bacterium]